MIEFLPRKKWRVDQLHRKAILDNNQRHLAPTTLAKGLLQWNQFSCLDLLHALVNSLRSKEVQSSQLP